VAAAGAAAGGQGFSSRSQEAVADVEDVSQAVAEEV